MILPLWQCHPFPVPALSFPESKISDDFIAGQWNSGQMVPASVMATTQAGNVKASHPAQLKMGGM